MSQNNGSSTSLRLKTGLAEMLKGGVIMDVTNAEQAVIAEKAGAVSVMALERVPHRFAPRAACSHGLAQEDSRDHGRGFHSGDGQVPHRAFLRKPKYFRTGRGLH